MSCVCPLIIALNAPNKIFIGVNLSGSETACGLSQPLPNIDCDIFCFDSIRPNEIIRVNALNTTIEIGNTAKEITLEFPDTTTCIKQFKRLFVEVSRIANPVYSRDLERGWHRPLKRAWRIVPDRNRKLRFLLKDKGPVVMCNCTRKQFCKACYESISVMHISSLGMFDQ